MNISIHQASLPDMQTMLSGFPDRKATFEQYFQEQSTGERIICIARHNDQFAGYVTLKWQSEYEPFSHQGIPEIKDLNVLPDYRKLGIATKLIEMTEKAAETRSTLVGIGVGLFSDYGAAQRLYFKLGYQPDGRGVTYNYKSASYGEKVLIDDEFCLWLIKDLG